jgi:hypothetical protein
MGAEWAGTRLRIMGTLMRVPVKFEELKGLVPTK